ncbi:MAG: FkbM family methyltransferase [Conexivisphaerales archaeon]
MFNTGIPTKLRHIRYGVKREGIYYYVKRPYGILYHTDKHEIINAIKEEHQYDSLNVKDKQVVDIGADTGDTALQFAYRGAKEVYAYEPNVNSFKAIDLTLIHNAYKNIKAFNEAVLGKAGFVSIDANATPNRSSPLTQGSFRIKATTLDEIVKTHNIRNGVLKMDCEGYEYEIIDNASDNTLLAFDSMAIEMHYKGEGKVVERLKHLGYMVDIPAKHKEIFLIFARR